jgi:hypothetical protein
MAPLVREAVRAYLGWPQRGKTLKKFSFIGSGSYPKGIFIGSLCPGNQPLLVHPRYRGRPQRGYCERKDLCGTRIRGHCEPLARRFFRSQGCRENPGLIRIPGHGDPPPKGAAHPRSHRLLGSCERAKNPGVFRALTEFFSTGASKGRQEISDQRDPEEFLVDRVIELSIRGHQGSFFLFCQS